MSTFTESVVEEATLTWLDERGFTTLNGLTTDMAVINSYGNTYQARNH